MDAGRRLTRRVRYWLLERLVVPLAPHLIRAHLRTLRIRTEGLAPLRVHVERGGRVVLASWHQRLYGGIEPFRRFAPVMLISLSRDGAAAARVAERLGYAAIRGSSSRGAGSALVAIMRSVAEGRVAAHLVDGPRGPARRTKPGVVRIAQRARASIVPIYVAYARAWEARSWDRFQVPLPFTRVLVRAGPAIEVPVELERADRDELCARLDREFAAGFARADADVRRVPAPDGDARSQQSTCNTSR